MHISPNTRLWLFLLLIPVVGFGGYATLNWYDDYSKPKNVTKRLANKGELEKLLGMSENRQLSSELRYWAIQALNTAVFIDPEHPELEAGLVSLRDGSDIDTIRWVSRDALTRINGEITDSLINQLRDEVRNILLKDRLRRPEPSVLFADTPVDLLLGYTSDAGTPPFEHTSRFNVGLRFEGLSRAEIYAVRANIVRVGAVVDYSSTAGTYVGVGLECVGDAFQRNSDLYLVDLELQQVRAFRYLIGGSPPKTVSVGSGWAKCSGSGSFPDTGKYFQIIGQ